MNGQVVIRYHSLLILLVSVTTSYSFQLGVENLSPAFLNALKIDATTSYRIGLITNQTAHDQQGNRTVDILQQKGLRIAYILAPEHGFDGKEPAGKLIPNSVDKKTGVPILSVYGSGGDHTIAGKKISPLIMRQLDVLFYDIQDSGMRHYTYISTLLCALEAAAEHGKPIVVLDRPNFLGPYMEGPLVDTALKSFISIAPIPLRHGMTVGELATYFNTHVLSKPAKLRVIPMKEYTRTMTPPFLSPLSPNLASLGSVYGYSFLGIVGEIEPFDIGVGTPNAFQIIMLPDYLHFPAYEWAKVGSIFTKYGIRSSNYTMMGRKGKPCTGLKLHITDGKQIVAFELLIELLSFFTQTKLTLGYSGIFDKAVGIPHVKQLCHGKCQKKHIIPLVNDGLEQFFEQAKSAYLYNPLPEIRRLD